MNNFDTAYIAKILTFRSGDKGSAGNGSGKKKRALVVEGDGFIRTRLTKCLVAAGLNVDSAPNGRLGLVKLRVCKPDALIIEMNLGGIPGLQLIHRVRQETGFGTRPIYVFTFTDFIKRSDRKKLARTGAKLFDKLAISEENFVMNVAAELLEREPAAGQLKARALGAPGTAMPEPGVLDRLSETIGAVRAQAKHLANSIDVKVRIESCAKLRERVYSVLSCAAVGGFHNATRQAKALVGFLDHLRDRPQDLGDSASNTIASGVEVLSSLARGAASASEDVANLSVVVVDDAPASREAISDALKDAGLSPIAFGDPVQALDHLAGEPTDLIVANLTPAAQQEFNLAKIRTLQLHSETPALFVPPSTAPDDSDGSIPATEMVSTPQPVTHMEILMKALNLLHGRIEGDAPAVGAEATPEAPLHELPGTPSLDSGRGNQVPDAVQGRLVTPRVRQPEIPEEQMASSAQTLQAQGEQPGQQPGQKRQKRKIFLVEDDPVLQKVYKRALRNEGFRVESAEDGLAAIETLPKSRPDLVVLDIMLPKLHGLEVLKFIRADVNLKATPVVVLSNAFMEGLAAQAIQAGANTGLLKSQCTPAKLVSVISGLLGNAPEAAMAEAEKDRLEAETSFIVCGDGAETAIWARQNNTLRDSSGEIAKIRQSCRAYGKIAGMHNDDEHLDLLYRRVRYFCSRAGLSGFTKLDSIASALEALLFEITYKKVRVTPSILRTMAQAVDCLGRLAEAGDTTYPDPVRKPKVLVVDGDEVCMFTTVAALKLARVEAVGTRDPKACLRMLEASRFDLVILAVDMPELNGFEVCERLRWMPQYKTCPVMFVTVRDNIDDRARGVLAGASDYVVKPITPAELTVKITLLLAKAPPPAGSAEDDDDTIPIDLDSSEDGLQIEEIQSVTGESGPAPEACGSDDEIEVVGDPAATLRTSDEEVGEAHSVEAVDASRPQTVEETPSPVPPAVVESAGDRGQSATDVADNGEGAFTEQNPTGGNAEDVIMQAAGSQAPSDTPPADSHTPDSNPEEPASQERQSAQEDSASEPNTVAKPKKEWDGLVARVYNTENELYLERARVKRRDRTIEGLQKSLKTLKVQLEHKVLAVANGEELDVPSQSPEQLAAASAAASQAEEARHQVQARCSQLVQELEKLQQAHKELSGKLAGEQTQAAESEKRTKELETCLGQKATELETQVKERSQVEKELRQQLGAAGAARQQAQARCSQLEQELAELQQTHKVLGGKLAGEQTQAAESEKRTKELESRLGQRETELETQVKERSRVEKELRQQLGTAGAAQQQAQARCSQLEQELAKLQQAHKVLGGKLAGEQTQATESEKRIKDLESRLGQKQTELGTQVKERSQVETELRQRLGAAGAAQQQAQARCSQLEQELAKVRRAHQDLNGELARERTQASELNKRGQELERRLSERWVELERAKSELEKQTRTHSKAEAELRPQLESAEAGQQKAQARCSQLEQELAKLQQAREELNGKLARAQAQAAESDKHGKDLEKRLGQKVAELERSKAELEKQAKERSQAATDRQRQLDAAGAAQQQVQARCSQLEQELAKLQQAREELNGKLARAQAQAAESDKHGKDLEKRLGQKVAELERSKAELEKQAKERSQAVTDRQRQLDAAGAAQQQVQARCSQLEQELAGVRQAAEGLNKQLVQGQAQVAELDKRSEMLEKRLGVKTAELRKQTKDHLQVEMALQRQLDAAGAAQQQAQTRCTQLEQELAGMRRAHEELSGELAGEQTQAAESDKRSKELERLLEGKAAELEKQAKDRLQAEAGLRRQLNKANATQQQAQTRCTQLEQELTRIQQAQEELNGRMAREQAQAVDLEKRAKELETRLGQKVVELETQARERSQAETKLRLELETAGAAREQTQVRCSQLEQELTAMRQAREDLSGQLARERAQAAASEKQTKELESRLGQSVAALEGSKAELEKQVTERSLEETGLRRQLDAAGAAQQQAEARSNRLAEELAGMQQAREELDGKLARAQAQAAASERQSKELEKRLGDRAAELAEMDERIRRGVASLTRVTSDLEAERASRERAEQRNDVLTIQLRQLHEEASRNLEISRNSLERIAALEKQLRGNEEARTCLAAGLHQERAQRQLSEEQAEKAKELNKQYEQNIASLSEANQGLSSTQKNLQSMLEAGLARLHETELKLQQESADRERLGENLDAAERSLRSQRQVIERQEVQIEETLNALAEMESRSTREAAERHRLAEALQEAQRDAQLRSEQSRIELSKLQVALQSQQVERKRLETNLVRLRHKTIDAARTARVVRNRLRQQIGQPVGDLFQSTRGLLGLEMNAEQKALVETILQDVLLLKAHLEEPQLEKSDPPACEAKALN